MSAPHFIRFANRYCYSHKSRGMVRRCLLNGGLMLLFCGLALTVFADDFLPWMHQSQIAQEPNEDEDIALSLVIVLMMLAIIVSFVSYNILTSFYWDRGIFPPFLLNRSNNRYEAITHLAVNVIRHDYDGRVEKVRFLQQYLTTYYPQIKGTVRHSYQGAFHAPLTTVSITRWLAKRVKAEECERVYEFLFGLAMLDGRMGQREYDELNDFCTVARLNPGALSERVEKLRREHAEEARKAQEQREAQHNQNSSRYWLEKYLFVLGLRENHSETELKKAYRKWAKMYHPDMLKSVTAAEKEAHEQRFLEIQEAYEYLTRYRTAK